MPFPNSNVPPMTGGTKDANPMTENDVLLANDVLIDRPAVGSALNARMPSSSLATVPEKAKGLLLRMFADPYLLEKPDRADLVGQLRGCVAANPEVSELRVLLGMALCVNLEVPDAIEELQEGVRLAPNSFIAQLKMGELWMRLRVIDKADEHTSRAARLATNLAQAELARRQAATLRTMRREGIERGGYKSPWSLVTRIMRRFRRREQQEAIVAAEIS